MIFWNMIFDIGGYRKVSAIGLMVFRVRFEVKVKGEHRNFALCKISPKGKFRSSPSPKNQKLKPLTNRGTKARWKEELRNPDKDRSNVRNSVY